MIGFLAAVVYLVRTAITIFWIMDICNLPFMEMFDTTYPLNEMFWLLIYIFVGGFSIEVKS